MFKTTAFLLCVVVFNVFVDSFPSPQDEGFGNLEKKADEILSDFEKQFNQQRQRVYNLFHNFTRTSLGRGIDTDLDTGLSLSSLPNFGPDVHNKTTSTTTVSNGQSVTVNETIWTNSEGKQVGVYRVIISKSVGSNTEVDSNTDNTEPSVKSASEVDDLNNAV